MTHHCGLSYVASMSPSRELPQPREPVVPISPGLPPGILTPEGMTPEVAELLREQEQREQEALKQLRTMRVVVSLSGIASTLLCGLVVAQLFNWHLAGWLGLPELTAAAGIAATFIAGLLFHKGVINERLEEAYSSRQRLDIVGQSIGVLLGTPLIWLAVGWLLKVLI